MASHIPLLKKRGACSYKLVWSHPPQWCLLTVECGRCTAAWILQSRYSLNSLSLSTPLSKQPILLAVHAVKDVPALPACNEASANARSQSGLRTHIYCRSGTAT